MIAPHGHGDALPGGHEHVLHFPGALRRVDLDPIPLRQHRPRDREDDRHLGGRRNPQRPHLLDVRPHGGHVPPRPSAIEDRPHRGRPTPGASGRTHLQLDDLHRGPPRPRERASAPSRTRTDHPGTATGSRDRLRIPRTPSVPASPTPPPTISPTGSPHAPMIPPIINAPKGASPLNTRAYMLITRPRRTSGVSICTVLFAVAVNKTVPTPARNSSAPATPGRVTWLSAINPVQSSTAPQRRYDGRGPRAHVPATISEAARAPAPWAAMRNPKP